MACAASPAFVLAAVTPDDIPACAALYAHVFQHNPAYASIFETSEAQQLEALLWFFERRLHMLTAHGNPFFLARDPATNEVCGASGAILPDARPGLFAMLLYGLALWPLKWGWASMQRMMGIDQQMTEAMPPGAEECPHLSMVAVKPEYRRKGIASALLARLTEDLTVSRGRSTASIALNTQDASGVGLYTKRGFRVVDQREIRPPGSGKPFTSWTMVWERVAGSGGADSVKQ